jgi:predicted protein tyrosine phosphatase
MIKTVNFVSQSTIEKKINPSNKVAVISITCPNQSFALLPAGFHSVLRLAFDDLSDELVNEKNIPDIDLLGTVFWHNLTMPDGYHAKKINLFVQDCDLDPNCEHILVHCDDNLCRSSAVAQFISIAFKAEMNWNINKIDIANPRLLRLLNKYFNGEKFSYGKFKTTRLQNAVKI